MPPAEVEPAPQSCTFMLVALIGFPLRGSCRFAGLVGVCRSAGRSACGIFSGSENGVRISGLVGDASRERLAPLVLPAKPLGTAKPEAVRANMPAPPALSLSM